MNKERNVSGNRGAKWHVSGKGIGDTASSSRRIIQRDVPPPPANWSKRSTISDVQKRLNSKNTGSNQGFSWQKRRGTGDWKSGGGISTAKKYGPPPQGQRSKVADVRRRLGGQGTTKSGQRNITKLGKGPPKTGRPKIITTDPRLLVKPGKRSGPKGVVAGDAKKLRFADPLKTGQLDRLTRGETAKKIKLADQFHMLQQGDVARRLKLHKHAHKFGKVHHAANVARFRHPINAHHVYQHHPNFHHGVVSPAFGRYCVKYHYWGPSFFAGLCWYPRWNPWVAWSWHYHCPHHWDPRPIWCRPIVYGTCMPWVYWRVPVWTPLPVVACGTWVDLRPVVVAPAQSDLQLVAVRFVDPGHPEQRLGPRYRVWFRNVGNQPVVQPFNVMLFAGNNDQLAADPPQAGVRVMAIEAGGQQSVDVRLPVEVYTMGRNADGEPAPFRTLHVLVDANREVPEIARLNNGARLSPAEILPVDPAAFELDPEVVKSGADVVLAGEGFGPEPGQLLLHVHGQEVQAEILGWYDLGVRWSVPKLPLAAPTEAEVIVVRGDGAAANPLKITIAP